MLCIEASLRNGPTVWGLQTCCRTAVGVLQVPTMSEWISPCFLALIARDLSVSSNASLYFSCGRLRCKQTAYSTSYSSGTLRERAFDVHFCFIHRTTVSWRALVDLLMTMRPTTSVCYWLSTSLARKPCYTHLACVRINYTHSCLQTSPFAQLHDMVWVIAHALF